MPKQPALSRQGPPQVEPEVYTPACQLTSLEICSLGSNRLVACQAERCEQTLGQPAMRLAFFSAGKLGCLPALERPSPQQVETKRIRTSLD